MTFHRTFALVTLFGGITATACFGLASAAEPTPAPDVQSDGGSVDPETPSGAARDAGPTSVPGSTPSASPASAEAPSAEASASLVTLEVEAVGFDDDRGHAMAMLFRPGTNVLDKDEAFSQVKSELQNGAARLRFPPVEEGTYALVVFHDTNDNGVVDHNLLHLPSEQLGFSNEFRPGIFSGLPTFDKLKFRLERSARSGPVMLRIVVK